MNRLTSISTRPFPDRLLLFWLSSGLAVQLGLVLWPIGNYATLVYLLFYLPIVLIVTLRWKRVCEIVNRADRPLLLTLGGLMIWVPLSTLWATPPEETPWINFVDTVQSVVLISLYILGISYLVNESRKAFQYALLAGLALAAFLALGSLLNYSAELKAKSSWPLGSVRLSSLGFGAITERSNSVPVGIYFGCLASLGTVLGLWWRKSGNHIVAVLTAVLVLFCLITTLFTWTRTAFLGLVGGGLLALWLCGRPRLAGLLTLTGLIAAVVITLLRYEEITTFLMRGGIGSMRPAIWGASLKASFSHLLYGAGLGSDSGLIVQSGGKSFPQPHSHNFYLQIFFWCGLVGLAFYLAVLGRTYAFTLSKRDQLAGSLGSVLLGYFLIVQMFDVYNVFTNPSYYWPGVWLPVGVAFALPGRAKGPVASARQAPARLRRTINSVKSES